MAKKSHLIVAAAVLAGFALSACNTVSGVGQDLRALGAAVTNAAERNQPRRSVRRATPTPAPHATPAARTPAPR